MYTVYRHLDGDNNVLYVGKSINILKRCMSHKCTSRWFHKVKNIEYIELEDEELMSECDVYFIKKFNTEYNILDRGCMIIDLKNFEDYKWRVLNKESIYRIKNNYCTKEEIKDLLDIDFNSIFGISDEEYSENIKNNIINDSKIKIKEKYNKQILKGTGFLVSIYTVVSVCFKNKINIEEFCNYLIKIGVLTKFGYGYTSAYISHKYSNIIYIHDRMKHQYNYKTNLTLEGSYFIVELGYEYLNNK